ncbi:hypothetical protein N0V90_010049 [Kalmusia sp. IMI 367209]|nr:hypothetical protein N0V90_010049 [Kalmusia sp. IMI 367209]
MSEKLEKVDVRRIKEELDKDTRDVSDLWNDALRSYKGIVGVGLTPTYTSVDEMIKAGTEQMNAFHKFRHNDKKVDKLRSLFMSNLDYIEKGAQQIIAAATPAFPPAAAIGTALTYMLSACKQVSADYDVVTAFFEDMNAFLQRITILESRLPSYPAYRNCLMDVFTSVLEMCGFATKYIQLRRFKKWILNMVRGEDTELAGARKKMDTRLSRLQSATEYAILGNTEKLQTMSAELQQNEEMQMQMLEEQTKMLETVIEGQDSVRNDLKDIRKLLSVFEEQRKEESHAGKQKSAIGKPPTSNRVHAFFYDLIDPAHEHRNLKDSFISEMSTWIFDEPEWADWLEQGKDSSKLLYIAGPPGAGKSHLALSAHDRLVQLAEREPEKNTCVVKFYFRETRDETRCFYYAINWLVIQIAEWNDHLCEKINVELAREDLEIDVNNWQDIWEKVIVPLFNSSPQARLQIVFDGLDELAPDGVQRPAGFDFLKKVSESDSNISVLCTTRSTSSTSTFPSQLNEIGSKSISVTKEKQLPDLKTLIWHHLDNDPGLTKLSQYMRQRIASTLEEKADCLLYAEHILRRFNNLNREPLILRHLEQEMPNNLEQLYTIILSDLLRKTNSEQRVALKSLFIWLAFSVRPITLSEATSLVKLLPGDLDLEEELQGPQLARFLRIADRIEAVDLSSSSSDSDLEDLQEQGSRHEGASDDWNLPLKFQERSMRDFFRNAKADEDPESLRTPGFEAHRQIFVTLSEILCKKAGTDISDRLRGFAASSWLMHLGWVWWYNKLGKPTEEQKIVLLDAIGALFTNQGDVATNIELSDVDYSYLGTGGLETKMKFFAAWASELGEGKLKESTVTWAQDVSSNWENAFLSLAKAHVQKWFRAADLKSAQRSYKYARSALGLTNMKNLLHEIDYDDEDDEDDDEKTIASEEIIAVSKAFPDITDTNAPYAIALLLYDSYHYDAALPEAQNALELASSDLIKIFQVTDLLANIQFELEDYQTAFNTITAVLSQTKDIPADLIRRGLITRAKIESALDRIDDSVASYQAARLAQPDTPMLGDDLQAEFDTFVYHKLDDPASIIAAVKRCDHHQDFQRACGRARETDFMVSAYEEAITLLDAVDAGSPIRRELAVAQWQVRGDLSAAKVLFNEILGGSSDGSNQRFTQEDPAWTLVQTIDFATDLLYEEFRTTADPRRKAELVEETKSLTSRPLARAVSSWKSMVNHQRVVLAKMVKRVGPAAEYQELLQKAFDVAYEALLDNVGWNDFANLRSLSMVLSLMGGFEKEARILMSAQFSNLDKALDDEKKSEEKDEAPNDENTGGGDGGDDEGNDEDDNDGDESNWEDDPDGNDDDDDDDDSLPDDEGDLAGDVYCYCDGECKDPIQWRAWKGRPLYYCLICADIALCEECYQKRQKYNKGYKSEVGAEYCGKNHKYLKGPIEGWHGVKDGMIMIEGEESVEFKSWLKELKEVRWREAWERFWLAED